MSASPSGLFQIEQAVNQSRNAILDRFLLASFIFGLPGAISVAWRDITLGFIAFNTVLNFAMVVAVAGGLIYRHSVSFKAKAFILFSCYLMLATKQLLFFGPISGSDLFLCFCCLILTLTFNFKKGMAISLLCGMIIPFIAYLHFSGIYVIHADYDALLNSKAVWVTKYASFLLIIFVILFGVGQLQQELNQNFSLLRKMVLELNDTNKKLEQEVELKNAYSESLLMSIRKFQGLFEGSRDGVLLLDHTAHIIEANQAVLDATGYSLEELRKINVFDLIEEHRRADTVTRFQNNILGNFQSSLNETAIVTKDGRIVHVEINSNVIVSDHEVAVLSTVRDISYRKQVENDKFNAVIEAEERERERLSKDLHDDLGPVFSTLKLYLQTLSQKENDPAKRDVLTNLSGIVDTAVKQVREISHDLSPYLLRNLGLSEAIRTHLKRYQDNGLIQTDLRLSSQNQLKLSPDREIAIYRIFLELLNNTIKHSGATSVRISISRTPQEFVFFYADNGTGFDPVASMQSGGGIGLKNIESRVAALNGTVNFQYIEQEMCVEIRISV